MIKECIDFIDQLKNTQGLGKMRERCINCPRKKKECLGIIPKCKVKREQLEEQIISVLKILYEEDKYLLLVNANEVCISAHLWHYFKNKYDKDYVGFNIDMEYNRNGIDPKTGQAMRRIRPDMIIHRRGCNKYNFACFEIKRTTRYLQQDYDKLKYITDNNNLYRYRYGISILLKNDVVTIVWFEEGKRKGTVKYDTIEWKCQIN